MINPSEINLSSLPWLPLEERSAFPRQPAIYFAIDAQDQIQYIGRSIDPKLRWSGHHRYEQLAAIERVRIAYLFVDSPELLPAIEAALIEWFDPPLNVAGKVFSSEPLKERQDSSQSQKKRPYTLPSGDEPGSQGMELEDFRSFYPELNRDQIARVAGCSIALVDRWIMTGRTRKEPSPDHKTRFAVAHWFWTNSANEPSFYEEGQCRIVCLGFRLGVSIR